LAETETNNIKFTENEMNFKNNNDEKMLTITNENVNVLKPLFLNGEQLDLNNLITKDEMKSEIKTDNIKLNNIETSKFVKNVNGFIGTSDDETISFTASFNVPIKITKIIFPTSFWHSNSTRTLVVSTMSDIPSSTTYEIQKINQHLDEHEIEFTSPIEIDDNKFYTFQLDVKSDDGFYRHESNGDIVVGGLNNYVIFDDVVGSVLGTKIPFDFEFEYISDKIINVDYLNTIALKSDLPDQKLDIGSSVDFNSVTINGSIILDDTFEVPNQSLQTNSDVKFNNVETSSINVGGFQTSTFDDENISGDVVCKYKHLKINDQLIESIRFDISTQDYLKSFKGNLQPSLDNQYDFGSESKRWQGVYANTVNTSNLLIDNVPFSDHSQSLVDMNSTIGIIEQTVQNIQAEVPSAAEMQSINATLTSISNTFTSLGITQLGHLNNAIQNTQTFPTASTFFHGNGESVARMVFMGGPNSPDDGRITSEIVFANDITSSEGWDINNGWNYSITSRNYSDAQKLEINETISKGHTNNLLTFRGDDIPYSYSLLTIFDTDASTTKSSSHLPSNVLTVSTSTQWASISGKYVNNEGGSNHGLPDPNSGVAETNGILGEWHDSYFENPTNVARLEINSDAIEITILRKKFDNTWEIVIENHECPNGDCNIYLPTSNATKQMRIIVTKDIDHGATRIYYLKWYTMNFNKIAEFGTEVQALSFRTLGSNKTLEERISTIESVLGIA
jgi:hypothetical protein